MPIIPLGTPVESPEPRDDGYYWDDFDETAGVWVKGSYFVVGDPSHEWRDTYYLNNQQARELGWWLLRNTKPPRRL